MKVKRMLIIPVVITVLVVVGWLVLRGRRTDSNDGIMASGTVEATEVDLGFQSGGRVSSVAVKEGDRVQRGAVLAQLEQSELMARQQAANAQIDAARALLAELEHGARPQEVGQAQAGVDAARRRMQEAEASAARARKLYAGGAISREALDQAETANTVARAQNRQSGEQLSLVQVGPRRERIDAQRAVLRQAQAVAQQVAASADNATISAPFSGIVTVRHREPGETVAPGLPVVTLMNPQDRWVRIYVREDQVGRVQIGQTARITSDSHPEKAYPGRVTFIASEAEFTPRNVQTAEDRVKLVYAIKVAVIGDAALHLKAGVPADVVLETH